MAHGSQPDPAACQHVCIEVSRGGLVKWGADGSVDFVSPVPCPFNYGSVPGPLAPDGDPQDALVLGPALSRGLTVSVRVVGRVRFVDAGQRDDKLICVALDRDTAPTARELWALRVFFALYAVVKAGAHRLLGHHGPTRSQGVELS